MDRHFDSSDRALEASGLLSRNPPPPANDPQGAIPGVSPLSQAIRDFQRSIRTFRWGQQPTTIYEGEKLKIADAFLDLMNIPREPFHSVPEKRFSRLHHHTIKQCSVYLMRNTRNGFTKIGYSISQTIREKTLQSEEPEVELIWSARGSRADETALHFKFDHLRIRGEWFNLSEADILSIKTFFTP